LQPVTALEFAAHTNAMLCYRASHQSALSTAAVAVVLSHAKCALFHRSLSADLQLITPRNLRKYFSTHDRALLW